MTAGDTVEDWREARESAVLERGKTKGQLAEDSWDQKRLHFLEKETENKAN